MNPRMASLLGCALAGVFLGGLCTVQALPRLSPVPATGEAATVLLFVAVFASGTLIGSLSGSVSGSLYRAVASVVLGLSIAAVVMALPVMTGLAGHVEVVSASALGRMLVLGVVLAPVGVLGAFVGSLLG